MVFSKVSDLGIKYSSYMKLDAIAHEKACSIREHSPTPSQAPICLRLLLYQGRPSEEGSG